MKAKELMIGDWVQVYGNNNNTSIPLHWYVRRITTDWLADIESRTETEEFIRSHGLTSEHPCIGDTKPIPLTEDILKANGAEPNEYGDWIVNKNDYFIGWSMIHKTVRIMTYSPTSGVEQDALVYCTRVHELQRALRCCGLWDLADNFKLE